MSQSHQRSGAGRGNSTERSEEFDSAKDAGNHSPCTFSCRKLTIFLLFNIFFSFQSGFLQGVMHLLLLSMSAHITKQLGMAPGGEFRAAFHAVRMVVANCTGTGCWYAYRRATFAAVERIWEIVQSASLCNAPWLL